jgi:3',5'-cyclic AMP phosphodiesterase CpdA
LHSGGVNANGLGKPEDWGVIDVAVRIAHLSDIHFGSKHFDSDLWKDVVHAVKEFTPHLIVVSGDIVDHPSPYHLLAAKCGLRNLTLSANPSAKVELCTVPGNHDVFEYGTNVGLSEQVWYRRIFGCSDTSAAEANLRRELNVDELAFNSQFLDGASPLWQAIKARLGSTPPFTRDLPDPPPRKLVWKPEDSPVLFALLDSNPKNPSGPLDLATGDVSDQQLHALRRELDEITTPYLVRVAVVHHHVLPVAYAQPSEKPPGISHGTSQRGHRVEGAGRASF